MSKFTLDLASPKDPGQAVKCAFLKGPVRGAFGVDWHTKTDGRSAFAIRNLPPHESGSHRKMYAAAGVHTKIHRDRCRAIEVMETWLVEEVFRLRVEMFGKDVAKDRIEAMLNSKLADAKSGSTEDPSIGVTLNYQKLAPGKYAVYDGLSKGRKKPGDINSLRQQSLPKMAAFLSTRVHVWYNASGFGFTLTVTDFFETGRSSTSRVGPTLPYRLGVAIVGEDAGERSGDGDETADGSADAGHDAKRQHEAIEGFADAGHDAKRQSTAPVAE